MKTKARRLEVSALALAIALVLGSGVAAADPFDDVLSKCVPGGSYGDCLHALAEAHIKLQTLQDGWVVFTLHDPLNSYAVRTYPKAAGRIVLVDVSISADKGKPRKELLDWLTKQIGATAKRTRSGLAAGAAAGCGADGWGVGWVAGASEEPEVQIQLNSPESQSADDEPDKLKPDDALITRQGNGLVDLCFMLPPKAPAQSYIDAPLLSPAILKAFLAAPKFHDGARPG